MPRGMPRAKAGAVRVVIAGGGTGGHLYPGLAIADEIRKMQPDAAILFVGRKGRIEERVVPGRGYALETIWISGFRRAWSVSLLLFPVRLAVALAQSWILLLRFRPRVVVGTGGYVCGPVVFFATLLGIPTLIQEQNSYPGVTTRLLARRVDEVHVAFGSTRRFLRRTDRILVSGNPVRLSSGEVSHDQACRFFDIDAGKPTLLVLGGSQGSVAVNSIVLESLRKILGAGIQVIWQTGQHDFARIEAAAGVKTAVDRGDLRVYPFIDRMAEAYAACNLVVARAGATTLAELTVLGKASVLIPLPTAAADHQTENARAMEAERAAIMIPENQARERLVPAVRQLFDSPRSLQSMEDEARRLGHPEAARTIAQSVLKLAGY